MSTAATKRRRPVVAPTNPTAPPHHEELVSGTAIFVDDVRRPGTLSAVIVRSAVAHGRLRAVDIEEARHMPGVHAVLTAADLDSVPVLPIRSFERPGMASAVQPVIAHERVRYVGEPVAVVVAEDPYLAEDAAERVVIEIDPLPAILDGREATETLFDRTEGNLFCRWEAFEGDIDTALSQAAVVIEQEFGLARHTGVPIETRGLLAEWSADGRGLRLWGATKFLSFTQRVIAQWFAIDEQAIDCEHVSVGGMFGVRGEIYPEDFLIPWAAKITQRPVSWIEDRREHLLAINHAPGLRYEVQVGLEADGRLSGFRAGIHVDMGAYVRTNGGRLALLTIEELPGPYLWNATAFVAEGWASNRAPVGSVRAPMAMESTFVRERAIDMAAIALGLDPLDVRRKSLVPAKSMPFTRKFGGEVHDQIYGDGDYPRGFARLLARADHDALCKARNRRRAQGELVGIGTGLFVAHSGLGEEEHVEVRVRQGRVTITTSASDIGQGLDRMVRLVASEALGITGENIDVRSGRAFQEAPTRGTYSSRSTIFVGNAVRDACERALEEARARQASQARAEIDSVGLDRGDRAAEDTIVPWDKLEDIAAVGTYRNEHATYGFGGHVALVSVNPLTAAVTVEQLTLVYDCGRAIDLPSVCDQLQGGAIHGLGATLLEELHYDENGQLLTVSFMDYLLPTCSDVPPAVQIEVLDGLDRTNPLGVKGTGEAGVIGVGAAVANALADALGATAPAVARLPLSPPVVDDLVSALDRPSASVTN